MFHTGSWMSVHNSNSSNLKTTPLLLESGTACSRHEKATSRRILSINIVMGKGESGRDKSDTHYKEGEETRRQSQAHWIYISWKYAPKIKKCQSTCTFHFFFNVFNWPFQNFEEFCRISGIFIIWYEWRKKVCWKWSTWKEGGKKSRRKALEYIEKRGVNEPEKREVFIFLHTASKRNMIKLHFPHTQFQTFQRKWHFLQCY